MDNNSKKNIFTKKNILIGIAILTVLALLIYFIFLREPEEKLLKCNMTIDGYVYANINMDINAYYTKKVNRVEGKVNFVVTNDNLKSQISTLESNLKNYYEKTITGDSIDINVSRDNYTIVINYSIDYNKIKDGDIETFGLFPMEEPGEKIKIDEFKNEIIKSGGTCVEE